MKLTRHSTIRNWGINISLMLLGIVVPLFLWEVGLRVEQLISKGKPFFQNPSARWDAELGWEGKEHILKSLNPSNQNILVIGDSFTEGLTVPSEQMWFHSLFKLYPDATITAYGGLGYGTLQELLVLKRYLKTQSPSLVVLQLCSNDFINNYRPLEEKSYSQRAPGPRPYLENGTIEIHFPRKLDFIIFPIISVSRIAYRYNNRLDELLAEWAHVKKIRSVEEDIIEKGFHFPLFRQSITITEELLSQFKQTLGEIPLVLVLVDHIEPNTTAFRKIAKKLNIPIFIPSKFNAFPPEERLTDGTHFNEGGNKHFGDVLVQLLQDKKESLH